MKNSLKGRMFEIADSRTPAMRNGEGKWTAF